MIECKCISHDFNKSFNEFFFLSFQPQQRWPSKSNILTNFFTLLVIINLLVNGIEAKLNFCDVETGQTNIILDIEESRGDCKYRFCTQFNQLLFKVGVRGLYVSDG